jgi:hypothetical protein
MKNAIDIGSRPYGKSAWSGKPGRWSAHHRAASVGSAPTITCGSRWCFRMFLRWRSRKPI